MDTVVGYNEFKDKMRLYLVNLAKNIRQGKKTEQTIYVLLGPPGIGKSFISEKVAEGMERPLINVDLGGRKDTGILEGTSPSVKGAYPGRLCQGLSVGKHRGSIILLDEFEKVADEGLAMMLGYKVDLSDCILLCTANYADQVPDFVQNRAEMVNIELATYQQRVGYVMGMLGKKLKSDKDTAHYANQLTEEF
ncbi:6513_t:CDS:2, partial [Funneliformis caledonium]